MNVAQVKCSCLQLFVVVDTAGQLLTALLTEYTQRWVQINPQGYAPLRNWDAWRGGQIRERSAWPASMKSHLSQQNGAFDGTCQVAPGLEEAEVEDEPGPRLWLDSGQRFGAHDLETSKEKSTEVSFCFFTIK